MIDTMTDQAPADHLHEAAAPLAAVLRALGEAPEAIPPAVASTALALAAEAVTSEAESCSCAISPGDLCDRCWSLSRQAVAYRPACRRSVQ
jgi:hypothetical protein